MWEQDSYAWEQRKLESLCDVFTDGDWIEAKDQSDSGIRLIQTGNVGTTEYLDKENNKKWISADTFERLRCEEIYPGDILISRLPEPAGRACIMPNLGTRMITAVDCTIVRTARNYDSQYLVQYLSTPMYFKKVNSFLGGGTRQRISRGNLSGIDVPIPPTMDEQKKIGECLGALDNLITLHQRKSKTRSTRRVCYSKCLYDEISLLLVMCVDMCENLIRVTFCCDRKSSWWGCLESLTVCFGNLIYKIVYVFVEVNDYGKIRDYGYNIDGIKDSAGERYCLFS